MSVVRPFYNNKESRHCQYFPIRDAGGVAKFSVLGDDLTLLGTSFSNIQDANGFRTKLGTAAFADSDAGIQGSKIYARNINSEIYCRFKLNQISSVRAFIGFTDKDAPTMLNVDNVLGSYFGLSYSTVRGDSNFKIITEDGGNSPSVTDTGIPVDTNIHDLYLQMIDFPSQVQWQIDDNDRGFASTNVLGLSTAVRTVGGVETQAAVTKEIEFGKILVKSDH